MGKEKLIEMLEEEITNIEGMKDHFNVRLDDAIERMKQIRFNLKYKD